MRQELINLLSVFAVTDNKNIKYDFHEENYTIKIDANELVDFYYNEWKQSDWLEDSDAELKHEAETFVDERFHTLEEVADISFECDDFRTSVYATKPSWNENVGGDPGDFELDVSGTLIIKVKFYKEYTMKEIAETLVRLWDGK